MIFRTVLAGFVTLALVTTVRAAPPPSPAGLSARAIALTSTDLTPPLVIGARYSQTVAPAQLNSDTVPQGLTVTHLRRAGFRGLYAQILQRPKDDVPLGYPWNYLAFSTATSAHLMWTEWVRNTTKPFNFLLGAARAGDECRAYRSVISAHEIGLLCRIGPFVVFGHYRSKAAVVGLMRIVVRKARRVAP